MVQVNFKNGVYMHEQELKPLVVDVTGLARLLGKTEAAIRQATYRKARWIPKPINLGDSICWRVSDVELLLEKLASDTTPKPKGRGRPRKIH